nr:hypothetical protein [Janthinobacterium sp. FT14W]
MSTIEVSQVTWARARENLIASAVVGHDLACLDLEGLAETRLDQVNRNGKLVGDEFRAIEAAADHFRIQIAGDGVQFGLGAGQLVGVGLVGGGDLLFCCLLRRQLDFFNLAGRDQLAFIDVLHQFDRFRCSGRVVNASERLQLRFGSFLGLAVRLRLTVQALDLLHRGNRIERDFPPVVMYVDWLAILDNDIAICIEFEFHLVAFWASALGNGLPAVHRVASACGIKKAAWLPRRP